MAHNDTVSKKYGLSSNDVIASFQEMIKRWSFVTSEASGGL
jgi:hypothetical protein